MDPPDPIYRRAEFGAGQRGGRRATAAHFFTDGPRPALSTEKNVISEIYHGRVRERALGVFKLWVPRTFASARPSTGTKRGALRSYRSRTIFGAVWDRDMVSALEHAGAVELSMRSWRFISGRSGAPSTVLRARVLGAMKRGSGRLGGAEGPHCASVGPFLCPFLWVVKQRGAVAR